MTSTEEVIEIGLQQGFVKIGVAGQDGSIWGTSPDFKLQASEVDHIIDILLGGSFPVPGNTIFLGEEKFIILRNMEENFICVQSLKDRRFGAVIFKFSIGIIVGVFSEASAQKWSASLPHGYASSLLYKLADSVSRAVSHPAKSARKA